MDERKRIIDRIRKNNGYITSKELLVMKINRYYISDMCKEGKVERVKRGVYRDSEYIIENELTEVSKIVPNGVICLNSAIEFYGLTTNNPFEYYIAIPRKLKITLPDYPPVKIVYFSDDNYNIGISEINIEGNVVKIYEIEKTICDIVRYRNKIGKDVFYEVLKEYLKRKDKNLNKLFEYAKKTRTYKILKASLELLI